MEFSNPFIEAQANLQQFPHLYFHRIEIKSVSDVYKLNSKVSKPIILILDSLPVFQHVSRQKALQQQLQNLGNVEELVVIAKGFGVFNQKYQLQRVGGVLAKIASNVKNGRETIKRIRLQLPGWRSMNNVVIQNIFQLIGGCTCLEELCLNFNRIMNLGKCASSSKSEGSESENSMGLEVGNQEEVYYGPRLFQIQQFQFLLKNITDLVPQSIVKMELRFNYYQGVNGIIFESLVSFLQRVYQKMPNLKVLKLDISGWSQEAPTISHQKQVQSLSISPKMVQKLFRSIQNFQNDSWELLEIDMRGWPSEYNLGKYQQRFMNLNGHKKKESYMMENSSNQWNTGSYFYGSQLRSKLNGNFMKVEIKY